MIRLSAPNTPLIYNVSYNPSTKNMQFTHVSGSFIIRFNKITQTTCNVTPNNHRMDLYIGVSKSGKIGASHWSTYDFPHFAWVGAQFISLNTEDRLIENPVNFSIPAQFYNEYCRGNKMVVRAHDRDKNDLQNMSKWQIWTPPNDVDSCLKYCTCGTWNNFAITQNINSLPPLEPAKPTLISTGECIDGNSVIKLIIDNPNTQHVERFSIRHSNTISGTYTEIASINVGDTPYEFIDTVNEGGFYKVVAINSLYNIESDIVQADKAPVIEANTITMNYPTLTYTGKTTNFCPDVEAVYWYLDGDFVGSGTTNTFQGELPNENDLFYLTAKYLIDGNLTGFSNEVALIFYREDIKETFPSNGTIVIPPGYHFMRYLIVAGGGGGGGANNPNVGGTIAGGGGGAGGLLTGTINNPVAGTYNVVRGQGAGGGTSDNRNGGNSSFYGMTAIGGGKGSGNTAFTNNVYNAGSGGSGGGGRRGSSTTTSGGAAGTSGQGNSGGSGNATFNTGGGGGGRGGNGGSGSNPVGGAGVTNNISGSNVTYARGGNGGSSTSSGAAATVVGGGGGGGWQQGEGISGGGAGANGIVIVHLYNEYPPIIQEPTIQAATSITCSETTINWTNNNPSGVIQGNHIQVLSGSTWTTIASVGATTTSFNLTGLIHNTQYLFRVAAYYETSLRPSNSVSIQTLSANPFNLSGFLINQTQISLSWNLECTDIGNEIQIQLREVGDIDWIIVDTVPNTGITFTYTDLSYNKDYQLRVVRVGSEYPSNIITFQTPDPSPFNLQVVGKDQFYIDLEWELPFVLDFEQQVRYRELGDVDWITGTTLPDTITTHQLTGLDAGITYEIQIVLLDGVDEYFSNIVQETTISLAPSDLQVTGKTSSSFDITWNNNDGVDDICIQIRPVSLFAMQLWQTVGTVTPPINTFTIDNLPPNTTYQIRVVLCSDQSLSSNVVTATTLIQPKSFCLEGKYETNDSECGLATGAIRLVDGEEYVKYYDFKLRDYLGNTYDFDEVQYAFTELPAGFYELIVQTKPQYWALYGRDECTFSFILIKDEDSTITLDRVLIRPAQCGGFDLQEGRITYRIEDGTTGSTYTMILINDLGQIIDNRSGLNKKDLFYVGADTVCAIIENETSGCRLLVDFYSIPIEDIKSIGGVKKLFIAKYVENLDYNYWSTADDDFFMEEEDTAFFLSTKIKEYVTDLQWYSLPIHNGQVELSQELRKVRQGWQFVDTLNIAVAKQTAEKLQDLLYISSNRWVYVLQDANGLWWTGGFSTPAEMEVMDLVGGRRNQTNEYQIQLMNMSADNILTAIDEDYVLNKIL